MTSHRYGFGVETNLDPAEAETRMREALADEGFGILTEIDVAVTLKTKLDVDVDPYRILGACNPQLAHKALSSEQSIGLLLPCNVIIYAKDEGSVIEVLEPNLMAELTANPDLREIAEDAHARLVRALGKIEAG
ncbi:MAG TPA: DUF302 domain-containing protein [Acidimicrobiia bacterium]|nr:DUF302 domain-containing protein [Acidimicrobiia bacterium]